MKIINTHMHIIEVDKIANQEKMRGLLASIPSFKNLEATLSILSLENILNQMKEAGITKSIAFALYCPILYASNEFVASLCSRFKDSFIGFASVDPKKEDAPLVLENAVKNLGLKGLKLHPPLQDFYANSPMLWPVYEKASNLGIPVIFHIGSTPFGSMVKLAQANPLLIDEVAVAFPRLKIILTHLGTMWQNVAFMLVEKNPNVYMDTAAYPYEIKNLLTPELVDRLGEDKFVFGTDFPMPYEGKTHRMKDFVDCIESLPLSGAVKEKIFYKNIERILECSL